MPLMPFGTPPTPDASSSKKGKVQLTGDLGNTAASPQVVNLHLSGDTAINHKLTSVTDPTAAQDAATKNYVDTRSSPAYTSWTPTWGNLTVGNGTVTAKYIQIGKYVHCIVNVNFGSTSSVSGFINLTLPTNFSSDYTTANTPIIGTGGCVATSGYFLFPRIKSGTTNTVELVAISSAVADAQSATSSTVPGTWNTSSTLNLNITYEAA